MIVTARQLEDLHRDGGRNGRVSLNAGTRLSPLARDWVRKARVEIEYVDSDPGTVRNGESGRNGTPRVRRVRWWCDGPCPVAKAALMMQESSVNLRPITTLNDASHTAIAVRKLADEISSRRADAGVVLVQSSGAATVYANRLNELRAVVGTTVDALGISMQSIKPNVLIIEHVDQPLMLIRNILTRFLHGGAPK